MTRPPRRIGILGLGAIGRAVARVLASGMPGLVLVGGTSRDAGRAHEFLAGLPGAPPLLRLEELLARADIVVEAATQATLAELAPSILDAGRDLVVLSVGALLDHPEWVERAAARRARIHVPSAAIAGLDGLKGAAVDGHLDSVVMETRKPRDRERPLREPPNGQARLPVDDRVSSRSRGAASGRDVGRRWT